MANEFKVKKGLIVQGSGSTLLDIQGSQGQLFSVTDSLSGSLFSVNDISGMPIMEVFSDDRVNLGTFNAEAIKVSGSTANITGSLFGTSSWAVSATDSTNATNATNISVADSGEDTTTWVLLGNSQTGTQQARTDAQLTYDAANRILTTQTFVGDLTGTAATASYVVQAISASFAISSSRAVTASFATIADSATSVSSIAANVDNNTDNYILTATGGTTVNGEANLTWNGSTLTIAGSVVQNGFGATVTGDGTHAEGKDTETIGNYSHAEGDTVKTGTIKGFHAGNTTTISSGVVTLDTTYGDVTAIFTSGNPLVFSDLAYDNVYGTVTFVINSAVWNGNNTVITLTDTSVSTSEAVCGDLVSINSWASSGGDSSILANSSHAEGNATSTFGVFSHAEGLSSLASGRASHAEGYQAIAGGPYSHAEGSTTLASGESSHAEGWNTQATTTYAHAEGRSTVASGEYSHAEGRSTSATGTGAHSEGEGAQATNTGAHAEGNSTVASGMYSHTEGISTQATLTGAHAEGNGTVASGNYSHAEGVSTTASGTTSHAEGEATYATGTGAHAEGNGAIATGNYSHAEGNVTQTKGLGSHAEGQSTIASGSYSHAEGYQTIAGGNYSHAAGLYTSASGNYQSVIGQYNVASTNQSAFIIGNGTAEGSRSNLIYASGSNVQVTGSLNASAGITGSLFGTSSYASQVLSASFATTASYVTQALSASFAVSSSRAVTSSFALSASLAVNAAFATSASRVDIRDTQTTAGDFYVTFVSANSGYNRLEVDSDRMTYNPAANRLTVAELDGNATTATTATTASYARTASLAPLYLPLTGGTISGNLTVVGTASFAYSTASIVQVGSNIITLNTNNPATRFGGISVTDSGSFGTSSTGSLLWDSQNNKWIYSNPSGSTYSGGMLISGPRNTGALGDETGMDANFIAVGQGSDHIRPGSIYNTGSGNLATTQISGSLTQGIAGNIAIGQGAHAQGESTQAIGNSSHTEGYTTVAAGTYSHAEGANTTALGDFTHAEGSQTVASGSYSHTEGLRAVTSGSWSHAEGYETTTRGDYSHTEGNTTIASGWYSHAEGTSYAGVDFTAYTIAEGYGSHAEGAGTQAVGTGAHAEGATYDIIATTLLIASGAYSHAEGLGTVSKGIGSHAEGSSTLAYGQASHAEGSGTTASGSYSHAEGALTVAKGNYSHAEGFNTVALGTYQSVAGQYNMSSSAQSAFIVGNGTSNTNRSNIIYASGSQVQITGSIFVTSSAATLGQFAGNQNGYVEFSIRNNSTGVSASGDIAIYADDGTVSNNYIDMGINNSGMNSTYSYFGTDFGNAHDAYVYNVGGNLRIGNATSAAPYSQSFYLFSNPTATPNIAITGSQVAINKSTNINSNFDISGSTLITGSLRGQVNALSIASNTASIDLSANNFFTISLVNGATTHISASNILPGQTVNIKVTQGSGGTGKLEFNTAIKSGSLYTGSAVANAVDIMTFISFDSSTLYMSAVTNLK